MKKVLITGGAGFIGANFARKFLDLGYKVNLIEKKGANIWRIKEIKNKINIYYFDLKDANKLESLIIRIKPEIVLHFAAYGTYPRNQKDIKQTIEVNLLGTINLINACSKVKLKCFINTGTSSEYGIKNVPIREHDLLEPDNLYGITKAAGTMYCQNMAKKLNFPIITMRPFAIYGYFEEKDRLIPTIIKSCLTNKELKLSSSDSVRDFIFIEDMIDAYLSVIKNCKKAKGEIFNLGAGEQTKIKEIVNMIKKITGSKIKPKYGKVELAQFEPKKWVADTSKIKKLLKWSPKYSLKDGLKKNILWFKNNIALYKK